MSADSIAISRDLVREGGLDQKAADAIAQKIVTHTDESQATKADLAKLEGKINAAMAEMRSEVRASVLISRINLGVSVAILLFFLTNSIG